MSYAVPFEILPLSYEEACSNLHSALRFGIVPTLDTTHTLLSELGDPDLAFSSLQIAGTNGKTSTARYTAAILRAAGYRTALYTSPELVSYTERMEVDGMPVKPAEFARGISAVLTAIARIDAHNAVRGIPPLEVTEFEMLTVAACVVFAEQGVESCVLEVGMGGRWDATSALRSIRTVAVTGIGLDHMHILGDTLEAIASEKAAVIQAGRSCVIGAGVVVSKGVERVMRDRCRDQGVLPVWVAPLEQSAAPAEAMVVGPSWWEGETVRYDIVRRPQDLGDSLELMVESPRGCYEALKARKPSYQAANIACACALVEAYIDSPLDVGLLRKAVRDCPTPGRFDVVRVNPLALVDACHNPQSVLAFLSAMKDAVPYVSDRPILLAAALADKDARRMSELLAAEFPRVMVCQTSSPRALAARELAALFRVAGVKVEAVCNSVADALALLSDVPFIACGSITLAGEVCALMAADGVRV